MAAPNTNTYSVLDAPLSCTELVMLGPDERPFELPENGGQLVLDVETAYDATIVFGAKGRVEPGVQWRLRPGLQVFNFYKNSNEVTFTTGFFGSLELRMYANQVGP